jgi:hypothetical protein
MNKDEALKLALEALYPISHNSTDDYRGQADKAITSLRQAIAELESQEPVAWVHNFIEGAISIGKRPTDLNRHPDRWTALYKDPKPCQTCEALARTVMLDQTSHDIPPQRTWVELTDEERSQLVTLHHGWNEYGQAIEAKLKEKNSD